MRRVYSNPGRIFSPASQVAIKTSFLVLGAFISAIRILIFFALTVLAWSLAHSGRIALFCAKETTRLRYGTAVLGFWFRSCARVFGFSVTVRGRRPEPGSLIVSNHRSYLDIPVLGVQSPCFFLSKIEVRRWPLIGSGAEAVGIAFVDRSDRSDRRKAIKEIMKRLDLGFTLVNFPEGTTSSSPDPLPFRPGLFRRVAGLPIVIHPTRIRYENEDCNWTGDDTFLRHLFKAATRIRTRVEVTFGEPIDASRYKNGDTLAKLCHRKVSSPDPEAVVLTKHIEKSTKWLKRPLIRQRHFSIREGAFTIRVYDQPGRWMTCRQLAHLRSKLFHVAKNSMDEPPLYGVFASRRSAFQNRIIAVVEESRTYGDKRFILPVGFTAMVYLPIKKHGVKQPLIHLGLTMIRKSHRGMGLQTALFKKVLTLPPINQRRLVFPITNIAASPAGIGSTADHFQEVYPDYKKETSPRSSHIRIAEYVLSRHRSEFGCSSKALFDSSSFVVRGSNAPEGGGAHQFIREDPVSRYRIESCNEYCKNTLRFDKGDELFQVGRVNFIKAWWVSRKAHIRKQ